MVTRRLGFVPRAAPCDGSRAGKDESYTTQLMQEMWQEDNQIFRWHLVKQAEAGRKGEKQVHILLETIQDLPQPADRLILVDILWNGELLHREARVAHQFANVKELIEAANAVGLFQDRALHTTLWVQGKQCEEHERFILRSGDHIRVEAFQKKDARAPRPHASRRQWWRYDDMGERGNFGGTLR
ncbi:unnamed protein product [Effrenium voratum]|uniref:Uncharacterized protein n=1 Tax=Effrenium voratum TaxID=2562239 RepID=A0AA36JE86_9DINO|nr:unnamed protein product [Effrenium voratum]